MSLSRLNREETGALRVEKGLSYTCDNTVILFQSSQQQIKDEPSDSGVSVEKSPALSGMWTENISWPCQRCDVALKGITRYMHHLEDFHPEDNGFFCPFCEQGGFDDKKELRRHVMKEHKVSGNG